ncbi:MAG: hypothetical protein ACLUSP_02930 [Christensenellales bacterium]
MGLMTAAEKFDYTKGFRFSTTPRGGSSRRLCVRHAISRPAYILQVTFSTKSSECNGFQTNSSRKTAEFPRRKNSPKKWVRT